MHTGTGEGSPRWAAVGTLRRVEGPATADGAAQADRFEADVVLADGGTVHVRPIVPADGDLLLRFHARQSSESIYFRYFSPRPNLTPA